jgi:hypothetical protein
MKIIRGCYFAIFAAVSLPANMPAATIDISSNTTTLIISGDTLKFQIVDSNFAMNAVAFGQSIYPDQILFSLASFPLVGAGNFQATLQSADGLSSVAFNNPLTFLDGTMQSSGYTGPISALNGYMHLSTGLSQALFTGDPVLSLAYNGPDITLSLDPYTMQQELQFTLESGPLSVGAIEGSVTLQTPEQILLRQASVPPGADVSAAPEPESSMLSFGGGTLLVGLSWLARRRARR